MRKAASFLVMVGAGVLGGFLFCWAQAIVHHPGSYYFTDVSASSPHNEDIGYLIEYGPTSGTSPTTYSPTLAVSRDQMASFLMRQTACDTVAAWLVVDVMYFDGYYYGEAAYQAGRITYDDYQYNMSLMDWLADLWLFEAGRMGSPRADAATVNFVSVARTAAAQVRNRAAEREEK